MRSKAGVSGFFEEIPALMLVTVAIAVFLFTAIHGYGNYLDGKENDQMMENARFLSLSIKDCEALVHDETGTLNSAKVAALDIDTLRAKYDPGALGYDYQVSIMDKSTYPSALNYTKSVSTVAVPEGESTYSTTAPISIWVSASEVHQGLLIVTIWR